MNYQKLLEYLGKLNEGDRLIEIERMAEDVFSDEFISLIKGQLQFAAKELAGAGYFEKVYAEEHEEMLQDIQTSIREEFKKNKKTWSSMIRINNGFKFRDPDPEKPYQHRVNHADEENLFDYDYCIKCGLKGASTRLCNKCFIDQ